MLPRRYRLTRSADISAVIAKGERRKLPHAIVYMWINPAGSTPKAAVAVGKAVGNSVVRSAVSRRIRHGLIPLVPNLPASAQLVVRAFPSSASISSTQWHAALVAALTPWLAADGKGAAVPAPPAQSDGASDQARHGGRS